MANLTDSKENLIEVNYRELLDFDKTGEYWSSLLTKMVTPEQLLKMAKDKNIAIIN